VWVTVPFDEVFNSAATFSSFDNCFHLEILSTYLRWKNND
jgi:hypothetical protein